MLNSDAWFFMMCSRTTCIWKGRRILLVVPYFSLSLSSSFLTFRTIHIPLPSACLKKTSGGGSHNACLLLISDSSRCNRFLKQTGREIITTRASLSSRAEATALHSCPSQSMSLGNNSKDEEVKRNSSSQSRSKIRKTAFDISIQKRCEDKERDRQVI